MKKTLFTALLVAVAAFGEPSILEKIDAKMAPSSTETYRKLVNIEPDGSKKEFLLYQLKKDKDKMLSLFLQPDSEKGRSTLRLGENMWLYLPDVGKPIRITSMQSVTGGVFNNSDIMQVDYAVEYDVINQREEAGEIVLDLQAKNDTIAYDKLIMHVDPATLTPTKIICYTSTGMLIKTLYFKDIKEFGGGIVRPAVIETDSPLYKGYKSILVIGKMDPKVLADEVFTIENMGKVQELR
ncbi:outer membrane lipoprotein-sorting protein [Sulfurospirillum sp. T05]|uniref:Outer membrane lipoprotein-sorting protein n=1 Tax=Sulfurospirillum tamanense TaxID=2813362 RepID=A0ABS2WTU4_9BACT|nr:outer membrane lipoprotein-sorting protein [Sulfurospirillum tamanensis]MBN2965072.1 outer membrane lipoprotein-sorting protein [Sulfurospirillum tamanensis]